MQILGTHGGGGGLPKFVQGEEVTGLMYVHIFCKRLFLTLAGTLRKFSDEALFKCQMESRRFENFKGGVFPKSMYTGGMAKCVQVRTRGILSFLYVHYLNGP